MDSHNINLVEAYNDGFLVKLSKEFYEQAAVLSAAYKFTGNNYVEIFPIEDRCVGIYIKPKSGVSISDAEAASYGFINEVLDQQVRINNDRENGNIKDVIVEHAFSPVKKKTL
jgi:His-Xaa-Ser system protein HxsD